MRLLGGRHCLRVVPQVGVEDLAVVDFAPRRGPVVHVRRTVRPEPDGGLLDEHEGVGLDAQHLDEPDAAAERRSRAAGERPGAEPLVLRIPHGEGLGLDDRLRLAAPALPHEQHPEKQRLVAPAPGVPRDADGVWRGARRQHGEDRPDVVQPRGVAEPRNRVEIRGKEPCLRDQFAEREASSHGSSVARCGVFVYGSCFTWNVSGVGLNP